MRPLDIPMRLVLWVLWIICGRITAAPQLFSPVTTPPSSTSSIEKTAFDFQALLNAQVAASKARAQSKTWPTASALMTPLTSIKWHEVIERLLEVRCQPDRMTVLLHYEKTYSRLPPSLVDILQKGRLYSESAGPNSPQCSSSTAVFNEEGSLTLTLDYDDCGVEMGRGTDDTFLYSISVLVEASINVTFTRSTDQMDGNEEIDEQQEDSLKQIRERYRFQCMHPSRKQSLEEHLSFSLLMSGEKYPKSYWTDPRTIDLGSLVYLYSEATLSWYKDTGLYSFPVNCWTSPYQSSSSSNSGRQGGNWRPRRKLFLKDGCPVNDARGRGLSQTHHLQHGPTKVSVNLGQYLLFDDEYEEVIGQNTAATNGSVVERRSRNVVTLNCEVVPCVQSFTFGLLNIPKCPISYFCSGIPEFSHALPVQLRSVARTVASAGPVTLRDKNEEKPSPKMNVTCQTACQQQISSGLIMGTKQPKPSSVVHVDGIKGQVVVLVALVSFLFGLVVMGALWWIHNKTDPTKSKALLVPATSESGVPPTSDASQMQCNYPLPSWHISRMKHRSETSDIDHSSDRNPMESTQTATNQIIHPFRIQVSTEKSKRSEANPSASPSSSLLTCWASKGVETGDSNANVDAETASRLLNTFT